MKRVVLITGFVGLGAVAAWAGWRLGSSSQEDAAPRIGKSPLPARSTAAPVTGDYSGMADSDPDPRKGRALPDILTLAEKLRFSPALETQGELLATLGKLEPDEIAPALEFLRKLPPPVPPELLRAALTRWAAFDAPAAMKWTEQLSPAQREEVRGGILSAWAQMDGKAAWDWYLKAWADAPEPRWRLERDFPMLIHAWALHDPKAAMEACLAEDKHGTFDGWSGFGSLAALPEHREAVLGLITGIPDDKKRQAALRSTLLHWARHDPASAAVWLDQYAPAKDDGNLIWSVAEYFGNSDPQANADWLLRRTPPEKRDGIMSYALSSWSRAEPEAAGAWLEQAGVTDTGAQIMIHAWAGRDLDRAVGWARRVSPAKRAEAVASAISGAIGNGGRPEGSDPKPEVKPDLSKYTEAAGVSTEELGKLVEKLQRQWRSRL